MSTSCDSNAVYINVDAECDACAHYEEMLEQKQDKLTAGDNIKIKNNVISATDTTYSAGTNVTISGNVISAKDTKYTAGDNVTISSDNVISATDTKYTAGSNVQISSAGVISATDTKYTAGTNISIVNGVISAVNTTYSTMDGATASKSGSTGLVPTPAAGKQNAFLRGDGTWQDAYQPFGTLSDGSSLNNRYEPGSWYLSASNTYGANPTSNAAMLYVIKNTAAGNITTQIIVDSDGDMYQRYGNISTGTWSKWSKMFGSKSLVASGTSIGSLHGMGMYYLDSNYTYTGMPSRIHPYGVLIVFEPMCSSEITGQFLISDNGLAVRYRTTESWSGWIQTVTTEAIYNTSYSYKGLTIAVKKIGNAVTMKISGTTTSAIATNDASVDLCTLAERYRPADGYDSLAILTNGSTSFRFGRVYVSTAGAVSIGYTRDMSFASATIPTNTAVRFTATWITEYMDN